MKLSVTVEFQFSDGEVRAIADFLGKHGRTLSRDDLARFVNQCVRRTVDQLDPDPDPDDDEQAES